MNTPNALPALTIANISIGQDSQGRYCLNDLHKAAGDEQKHKPANWLRLDQTKALIEEIDRSSEVMNEKNSVPVISGTEQNSRCSDVSNAINVIQGGNNQGTFVVKELVYAYAMWISPAFHLNVIRAYDALVMQSTNQGVDSSPNLAQLIPVFTGTLAGELTLLVNARHLHKFLDSKRSFVDWIRYRIKHYEFVENQDFRRVADRSSGRLYREYHLSLSTAKGIAMAKHTDKGRKVLDYLIDCEKPAPYALPNFSRNTMTPAEFQAAQHHLQTLSEQLKNVQIILTGADYVQLTHRAKQGGAA